jgi:hypothetical protein
VSPAGEHFVDEILGIGANDDLNRVAHDDDVEGTGGT